MSKRVVINSLTFARETASLQGELPVAELTRLHDMLVDATGSVRYRAEGRLGPRNRPQLLLQLDGVLSVRCQRCLESIAYPLKVSSLLEFVESEEDLTQEEMEDDSKDFLPAQSELDVVALIEDEIILDLPSAPRHDSCALPNTGQETGSASPFSVLAGLKGKA